MPLFDFGSGEVAAHRHVNPDGLLGGWVADTAYIDPTSYVHPYAFVCDNAQALGNSFVSQYSILKGNITIKNAVTKERQTNCVYSKRLRIKGAF